MGCPAKRWIGREGNGAEGRLWLNEIMGFFAFAVLATVAKRRNGLVFCVWVSVSFMAKILGLLWLIFPRGQQWRNEGMVWFSMYGSLFGFWQKFWVCCG